MTVVYTESAMFPDYIRIDSKICALVEFQHTLVRYREPAKDHIAEMSGPAGIHVILDGISRESAGKFLADRSVVVRTIFLQAYYVRIAVVKKTEHGISARLPVPYSGPLRLHDKSAYIIGNYAHRNSALPVSRTG